MLKAGSLLYSIFIALIISSIASSFILYNYYQKQRIAQYEGRLQALNRIESAFNLLKATAEDRVKQIGPLFNEDIVVTSLELQQWGAYYLATAQSSFRETYFHKTAFMGYFNTAPYALYLADNNQPLSLSGDTRIVGDVFLPKRGVKRAYIEGRSYTGKKLLDGSQQLSAAKVPLINTRLKGYLQESLRAGIPEIANEISSIDGDYKTVRRSFQDSTLCYYANGAIRLEKDSLLGRIIVKSEEEVWIGNQTYLENVIIIAPKVTIEAGSKGTYHVIASDSIIVGALTELSYPSSLLLSSKQTNMAIVLEDGAKVQGEVILDGENSFKNKGIIHLRENTEIVGNVYSFDRVELGGTVKGSVTCNKFLLKTSSSIYENHVLNGRVNARELPQEYLGAVGEKSAPVKKIIKWLN